MNMLKRVISGGRFQSRGKAKGLKRYRVVID